MVIIETPVFTRLIQSLLSDDEYRKLQGLLCLAPEAGDMIRGSGGLRKIRWTMGNRGKRGGVRVIYYWVSKAGKILMLYVYPKNIQSDLTALQLRQLRNLVEEEFK